MSLYNALESSPRWCIPLSEEHYLLYMESLKIAAMHGNSDFIRKLLASRMQYGDMADEVLASATSSDAVNSAHWALRHKFNPNAHKRAPLS